MSAVSRAFCGTAVAALVGAALLHLGVTVGLPGWGAMVHLILLGWISNMIFAVSYHTMPVFTGRTFPYPSIGVAHWVSFTVGILLAVVGMLMAARFVLLLGYALELTAALLFVINTIILIRRPRDGLRMPLPPHPDQAAIDRIGVWATQAAAVCLPLALALLLAVQGRWLNGGWHLAAEHLLTVGWTMLMIMGVAYHVLPRFSMRPLRGARWARAQVALHLVAVPMMVVGLGLGGAELFALGAAAMGLSLALFGWTVAPTLIALRLPTIAVSAIPVGVRHE